MLRFIGLLYCILIDKSVDVKCQIMKQCVLNDSLSNMVMPLCSSELETLTVYDTFDTRNYPLLSNLKTLKIKNCEHSFLNTWPICTKLQSLVIEKIDLNSLGSIWKLCPNLKNVKQKK